MCSFFLRKKLKGVGEENAAYIELDYSISFESKTQNEQSQENIKVATCRAILYLSLFPDFIALYVTACPQIDAQVSIRNPSPKQEIWVHSKTCSSKKNIKNLVTFD